MNTLALTRGLPRRSLSLNIDHLFAVLCVFIGVVSVYDAQLVVDNAYIQDMERNPVCLQLIELDPHGHSAFLFAKGLGTAGVLTVLLLLYRYWHVAAHPVAMAVGTFQAGLLLYLNVNWPYVAARTITIVEQLLSA